MRVSKINYMIYLRKILNRLLIGKNGFIAKKLIQRGSYVSTSSNTKNTDCLYLDLNNPKDFDYSILDENTNIIFLAAISSPDECNRNYDTAYNVNVVGTKHFINEAISRKSKVLFFSSDVVYGERVEEVDENSSLNPFGQYAKMKYEIEKSFDGVSYFKVFRLSYVLSKEDKYISYLKKCANNNIEAEIYHPFGRKVIFVDDVLAAIENILTRWEEFKNQKFNICGEQTVHRLDMATWYNNTINNKLDLKIIQTPNDFWKARPKNINIKSLYLESLLKRKATNIQDAIKQIGGLQ